MNEITSKNASAYNDDNVTAVLNIENADSFDTIEEAVNAADEWNSPIHSIRHIIKHNDKYYIKGHINCESCEHCGDLHAKNTRHAITIPTKFVESRYID